MLNFFRKYQRHFFLFIACIIGISFLFFGTHQVTFTRKQVDDRSLGLAIDRSSMKKQTIDEIVRFIGSDQNDRQLLEKRVMPNFFNDGVVRKDFLLNGIGVMLADRYFDALKEDFGKKAKKHKECVTHLTSNSPLITVQKLWDKVLPEQKQKLDKLIQEDLPIDPSLFSLFVDLYLGEMAFPPHALRHYMRMENKQNKSFDHADFSLFRCSSLEDWFGPMFLELVGQFIHNAALFAEQKGYKVSAEEAKVDLFRNGQRSLEMQKNPDTIGNLWNRQLSHLGMDEKTAVTVWQKVMLMRRLFTDCAHTAFVDRHPYECFHSYASQIALVDQYYLQDGLCIKNFDQLLKLIFYLKTVSASNWNWPDLPTQFASVESLKQTCPRLVCQRFLVEVSSVNKKEIASEISLKQMWDWQINPENFKTLQKAFPELAFSKAIDAEGYFAKLEAQPLPVRRKIDQYSRMQIIQSHPEWIEAALHQQKPMIREIIFSSDGHQIELQGVENGQKLLELFQLAPLKGESNGNQDVQVESALKLFSEDHQTYYRFRVLDRDENPHIYTFTQANKQKILDPLFEDDLKKQYPEVRLQNPLLFRTESNEWKPFHLVKQEIGRILYGEIVRLIESSAQKAGYTLSQNRFDGSDDFYPKHYLFPYINAAFSDIREKGAESAYLAKNLPHTDSEKLPPYSPLTQEWKLIKQAQSYKQSEDYPKFDRSPFTMKREEWSSVQKFEDGKMGFFQLREHQMPESSPPEGMKQGQEILSIEAQRYLMIELLDILSKTESIHLVCDLDAK